MTPEQIAAGAACYQCLNEDQKRAAILYLLDQFASGGSGGGGLFVLKAGDTMTGRLVSPNINYTAQGSTPTAPASGFVEFADSTGRKSWIRGSDGFVRTWDSTLTGNRVFSLPDATTTIAGLNVAQTFTLANTFSANGALSAPAVSFTGTPITGGTATTTKPLVLIETSGATSTGWVVGGTMFGINAPSGFSASGALISAQINGTEYFYVTGGGTRVKNSALTVDGNIILLSDVILSRKAAANLQLGAADAAAPVAQTLSVQSVVAGTSNTAGANWTLKGSASSGSGAGGNIVWQVTPAGSSGTAQNAFVTGLSLEPSGTTGTVVRIGSGSTTPLLFNFSGSTTGTAIAAGTSLAFYHSGNGVNEYGFAFTGANRSGTSGTVTEINFGRSFVPTSGTGIYNQLQLNPTINQTGGANGITRGIYVAPTLTAAADFRAIEVAAGDVVMPAGTTGMTSGFPHMPAAAGAPSGTPSARTGNVPFYYDTTNNKLYVYNGAWKSVTLT